MYVAVLRPAEVAVIIMAFAEYVCQPLEMYIGDIEEDSKETAKKYISILALGECLHVRQAAKPMPKQTNVSAYVMKEGTW
jgi:hypothetical protein